MRIFSIIVLGLIFTAAGKAASLVDFKKPDGSSLMLSIQQEYYKSGDWSRFFAHAVFYRKRMLSNEQGIKVHYKKELIALEVMAYARLCQWDAAERILDEMAQHEERVRSNLAVNEMREKLKLLQVYKIPYRPQTDLPKDNQKSLHWPMKLKDLDKVEHPEYLRMEVDDKC